MISLSGRNVIKNSKQSQMNWNEKENLLYGKSISIKSRKNFENQGVMSTIFYGLPH